MAEEAKPVVKRKAKIGRIIRRVHNIAKYESIDITVSSEDEIEFADLKEREKKCSNLTALLVQDMERTEKQVFSELRIEPKKAFGNKGDEIEEENKTLGE